MSVRSTIVIALAATLYSGFAMANGGLPGGGASTTQAGLVTLMANSVIGSFITHIFSAIGIGLSLIGMYGFYKQGEQPAQSPTSRNVSYMIAGTLLTVAGSAYAWTVNSISPTIWANDSTLLASGSNIATASGNVSGSFLGAYLPEQSIATLLSFIYIVGLISFFRGLFLMKNMGDMGAGQDNATGKALTHIFGGAAVMNILSVGCFLSWLLGISILCA